MIVTGAYRDYSQSSNLHQNKLASDWRKNELNSLLYVQRRQHMTTFKFLQQICLGVKSQRVLEIQNIICLFVFKIILVKGEAGVYDDTTITRPKSFKHFNIVILQFSSQMFQFFARLP